MKIFKNILLGTYVLIEILAIVLFVSNKMSATSFFLISTSMSLMIGLYFMDRNKQKKWPKKN